MSSTNKATVSLGKLVKAPFLVPVLHNSTPNCINDPFMVNGQPYKVTALSLGGIPHGGVLMDDVDSVDVPVLGHALGTHCLFPKGADIVFIQVIDTANVKARLWQRDIGETAFTKEAAAIAVIVAYMLQKLHYSNSNVYIAENTFNVDWNIVTDDVKITGPADMIGV